MSTRTLRDALVADLAFVASGEPAGNVTAGHGALDGRRVHVALVENRVASGAIGTAEARRLGAMFSVAASERAPVVLFLDSAGAKVSEGLRALGSFRALYRNGLEAALKGVPIAAALGRNCYGGSSMLAHLASRRLFSPETKLAMSGPAVIASASGMDPLDDMFRAMADATLSAASRAMASAANTVWNPQTGPAQWLRVALAECGDPLVGFRARHDALATRFRRPLAPQAWESVHRRDLARIYDGGYEAREGDGILEGRGTRGGLEERFVGLVGKGALNAARAWRFSQIVWALLEAPPERLEVFLDCASHAARLDEEKMVLTEYVVDMGAALASLGSKASRVGLTVAGKAGGGVYVALAAPAARVASLHGADIQVLPGSAVAAILGEASESAPAFADYRAAGVAEQEFKLGLLPGNA
ncbi:MAG: carboxyl transferase domain-containing protein [Usitatibacter sp.]